MKKFSGKDTPLNRINTEYQAPIVIILVVKDISIEMKMRENLFKNFGYNINRLAISKNVHLNLVHSDTRGTSPGELHTEAG